MKEIKLREMSNLRCKNRTIGVFEFYMEKRARVLRLSDKLIACVGKTNLADRLGSKVR